MAQQSDPENIHRKSISRCMVECVCCSWGGAQKQSMYYISNENALKITGSISCQGNNTIPRMQDVSCILCAFVEFHHLACSSASWDIMAWWLQKFTQVWIQYTAEIQHSKFSFKLTGFSNFNNVFQTYYTGYLPTLAAYRRYSWADSTNYCSVYLASIVEAFFMT